MKRIITCFAVAFLPIFVFGQTTSTVYSTGSAGTKISGYATGSGVYTEGDLTIEGYGTATTTPVEDGGYCVFDLSAIPRGATVTSVTFGYYQTAYTAGSGAPTCITYGFAGDLSKYTGNGYYVYNNLTTGTMLSSTAYGTSAGSNQTLSLSTTFFSVNAGGKISICMTASGGTTRIYGVKGESGNTTSTTTANHAPYLSVTYTAPTACSGTPVAGTATCSPCGGNSTSGLTLSLSGASTGNGLTYQWQSSSTGTSGWTNISGATSVNWSIAGISANTYYRCNVTCSGTTTASTVIEGYYLPAASCNPSYTYTYSALYYSFYLNPSPLTGDNATSLVDVSNPSTSGYNDLTDNVNLGTVTLYRGLTHSLTINSGGLNNPYECYVYIDYNNDGTFQTSELAGSSSSVGASATITLSVVPATAVTGVCRMRMVGDYNAAPASACAAMTYGESRDYLVNIVPQPTLTGTSSIAFGSVNVGNYSSDMPLTFNATNLQPSSGNLTITMPSNYYVHSGGVYYSSYSYAYSSSAVSAGSVNIAFDPSASASYPATISISGGGLSTSASIALTGTGVIPACNTVTYSAGTTVVSPEYGSSGATIALSLSGLTSASGLTYQWYSSPDNATWTSLGTAATTTAYSTTLSGNTWYYCKATCAAGGSNHSSVSNGVAVTACAPTVNSWGTTSTTLSYTGGAQTFVVPTGVSSLSVDVQGACGGFSYTSPTATGTGYGGRVQATLSVTPGQTLYAYVGGVGANGYNTSGSAGGYNGGGASPSWGVYLNGGGGGGATDIRLGGTALTNRIVVAGGGGGDGANSGDYFGGAGGGLTGGSGQCISGGTAATGGNSTSASGGTGGGYTGYQTGTTGTLGAGGTNLGVCGSCTGTKSGICGGGGGGYYGGGGGGWGGGGGGSSYTNGTYASGVTHTQGYNSGAGTIVFTYPANNTSNGISQFTIYNGATNLLSDVSMNTAADPNSGYLNRLTTTVSMTQGGVYASSATWATASSYQEVQVWIDFNDDQTFQTTEEVTPVSGNGTGGTTNPTAFDITIPVNANPGKHMMRVRAVKEDPSNGYIADSHLDPCTNQYLPPVGSVYNSGDVADYFVTIQGLTVSAPASDTLAFGTQNLGSYTATQTITFSGSYLAPTTGALTINIPDGFYVYDGTTYWSTSYTLNYTSGVINGSTTPPGSLQIAFNPAYNMPYVASLAILGSGAPTKYIVLTGTGTSACSGTPSGGYAGVAPAYGTGGSGSPFVLSLTGIPTTTGLTYQWYSSPDNSTWTSIGSAATTATYSYTVAISANTYFRCQVGCPAGGGSPTYAYSGSVMATYFTHAALCTPTAFNYAYPSSASWTAKTTTYSTPGYHAWVVPTGVTSINVDVQGATGGTSSTAYNRAGYGGRVTGNYPVTAGQVLYIYVGGAGTTGSLAVAAGGYNGGGNGEANLTYGGGGGGGASDIRLNGTSLTSRIFVAGGGGGAGMYNASGSNKERGGDGGGTTTGTGAVAGENGYYNSATTGGGGGGTAAGGAGSTSFSPTGGTGISGTGGVGSSPNASGGGGGGFYGGGGGSNNGGGGGSNYASASANNVVHTRGYNSGGNGQVLITYSNETTADGMDGLFVTGATGTNLNDASGISSAANSGTGYVSRSGVAPITLYRGNSYASTLTWANTAAYQEAQAWIDFSNFGTIETSEVVSAPSAGSSGGTAVGYSTTTPSGPTGFYINIPSSAPTGTFLMRVRAIQEDPAYTETGPSTYLDPCLYDYSGATTPAYLAGDIADYVININAPAAGVTMSPGTIAFGGVVAGYISTSQSFTLAGSNLSSGGSLTITPPAGFDINVGGTRYGSNSSLCTGGASYVYTYSGTSISGISLAVEFTPTVSGVYGGSVSVTGGGLASPSTLNVSGTGNPPCTGTPSAGTTSVSPTTGNSGTAIALSNSAASTGGGITYQWESSPDLSTWTSISGATNTTYSFTGITATTYYHLKVTCPFTTTSTSNYVTVTYTGASSSCTPSLGSWVSEYGNIGSAVDQVAISIAGGTNFSSTGIVAAATAANPSTGYLDRTSTSMTLFRGGVYPVSITWGTTPASYDEVQIWVDFNDDGVFATNEEVSAVNAYGTTANPTTFNITIPSVAALGTHLMRVRGVVENSGTYTLSTHLDPCNEQYGATNPTYYSGDAVDFKVSIQQTSITLGTGPTACQSGSSSTVSQSYSATNGGPNQYSITWAGSAHGLFTDVAYTTLPASPITITVPGGVAAGTYYGSFLVRNSTSGSASSASTLSVYVNSATSIVSSFVTPSGPGLCSGTNVNLNVVTSGGSGVATYTWTGPGLGAGVTNTSSSIPYSGTSTIATSVASGSQTGQYSVAITYAGTGCSSISPTAASSTVYTVSAQPTLTGSVTATSAVMCSGATQILSCNAVSGGLPGPTYTWYGPGVNGVTSTGNSLSVATSSTVTSTGIYSMSIAWAGGSGCNAASATASAPATVNPQPVTTGTLTASATQLCSGASESISSSSPTGGSGSLVYTWSGPGISVTTGSTNTPTAFTPTVSVTTIGAYSVAINFAGVSCTTYAASPIVTVNPQPFVSMTATPANLCSGGAETLGGIVTGGIGSQTYTWSGPGIATTTGVTSSPAAFTPTVAATTTGVYSVTVNFSGAGCNSVTATSPSVTIDKTPSLGTIVTSVSNICAGLPISLSETGTPSSPTSGTNVFTWSGPAGVITTGSALSGSTVQTLVATSTGYSGIYSLSATYTEAGCAATTVTSGALTVNPQPTGSLTLSYPGYICPAATESITANVAGASGSPVFTWSGPGIATPTSTGTANTFTVVPTSAGVYTVVAVYTVTGCNTDTMFSSSVDPVTLMWTGVTSADWNTASNWSCGTVPTATDSALIPSGTTYEPALAASATGSVGILKVGTGASLTLGSSAILNVHANLLDTGSVSGSGWIVMDGSSAQTIYGNGSVGNLKINNSSGVSINATTDTLAVTGKLTLSSGVFNTNNGLILSMSDDPIAVPANGRIDSIVAGGGSLTGKVIIQQYVKGGRRAYRFWGTPFVDSIPLSQLENYIDITGNFGNLHGFTYTPSNAASAFWYHTKNSNSLATGSGGDPGWKPFTWCVDSMSGPTLVSQDSNLVHRFEGFRLFFRGSKGQGLDNSPYTPNPVTVRQWGTVNTGTLDVPLQRGTLLSGGSPAQDYNQKSNPYPSPVDLGAVVYNAYNAGALYQPVFYVWNAYGGAAGVFVTVDESSYTKYVINANASYQVRAAYDGALLHFTEDNKADSGSAVLLKSGVDQGAVLTVYDGDYHYWDQLKMKFTDAATENEDRKWDAGKPVNPDLNFYSWSADHRPLSIDARPFTEGKVIPLGLTSSYYQNYIIKADELNAPAGEQVYLHDKLLGKYIPLQQGTEYSFDVTQDPATQGDNRFELGFGSVGSVEHAGSHFSALVVPNPATSNVAISYVSPVKAPLSYRILTTEGVVLLHSGMGDGLTGTINVSLDALPSGMYLVEIAQGSDRVMQRLIKE